MMHAARIMCLPLFLALAACGSGQNSDPAPVQTTSAPTAAAATPKPIPQPAAVPAEPDATAPAAAAPAAPGEPARWGMLFIAGDHSITAFDNATRRFYNIVQAKPRVKLARLTSDTSIARSPADVATLATLDESLGYINSTQAESCLLFMTSHGGKKGFYLSQHDGVGGILPPRTLDWLLDKHCGAKPTVAIISACFSGLFLEEGMEQPNRIILTAARRDRPSFGCSADEIYTYYDKCLLDSWLWAYTWRELHEKTNACVAAREAEMGMDPSEPQAFFGTDVIELPMP